MKLVDVPLGTSRGRLEHEDRIYVIDHLAVFIGPGAEGVVGVFAGGFFFRELDGREAAAVAGGGAAGGEQGESCNDHEKEGKLHRKTHG